MLMSPSLLPLRHSHDPNNCQVTSVLFVSESLSNLAFSSLFSADMLVWGFQHFWLKIVRVALTSLLSTLSTYSLFSRWSSDWSARKAEVFASPSFLKIGIGSLRLVHKIQIPLSGLPSLEWSKPKLESNLLSYLHIPSRPAPMGFNHQENK